MVTGQQDFQSLVLSCNRDGMEALRKGQQKAAFEQFKYAEAVLIANQSETDTTSLLAVTCNNLGCYYKKVGKYHGALSYLRRALKMEIELKTHKVTLAGTQLNICAILSKLDKHDKAVQHAMSALELINSLVNETEPDKVSQDDYSVLAIAYHNVAVERDFLKEYEKAAAAFQQGHQVAKRCLGEQHPLSQTLQKNCDAVLLKSKKMMKVSTGTGYMKDALSDKDSRIVLPGILSARNPRSAQGPQSDALDWKQAANGSLTALDVQPERQSAALMEEKGYPALTPSPPPQTSGTRDEAELPLTPSFREKELTLRDAAPSDLVPSSMRTKLASLEKTIDNEPAALVEMIDADVSMNALTFSRTAPNDYRPNRVIKGSTRTSRVVRRTGMFHDSKRRDDILNNKVVRKGAPQRIEYVRKAAAEKIQRVWRAWFRYCQENADWMTTTWIAATMIQSRWRSYHVRRMKLDRAACIIQRHARGNIVRKTLKHHRAAVVIQRRIVGILTRSQLRHMHYAAVKIQSMLRMRFAKTRVRKKREFMTKTALKIQCAVRRSQAKARVGGIRKVKAAQQRRDKAVLDIQRCWRGFKGRKRAAVFREQYGEDLQRHKAAVKLQAMLRRDAASRRVDGIRADRLGKMNSAATHLRKMWLGARTRKRYRGLVNEFRTHEGNIVIIQRYGRGFLVRLRMWREAVHAEEKLWAALEIQRIWRGYLGRVKWEEAYERVWRQEMGAVTISRHIRGWLARLRVTRKRRKIARSEFDRARQRFKAAQKIQALARRVLARKRVSAKQRRVVGACVHIQRIARGHQLRVRLWKQVIGLRATMMTSAARGFLVRNRRFHLVAKVICIQRFYRQWLRKPASFRQQAFENMRERKAKAGIIQDAVRKRSEQKELDRIQATGTTDLDQTQPLPASTSA